MGATVHVKRDLFIHDNKTSSNSWCYTVNRTLSFECYDRMNNFTNKIRKMKIRNTSSLTIQQMIYKSHTFYPTPEK